MSKRAAASGGGSGGGDPPMKGAAAASSSAPAAPGTPVRRRVGGDEEIIYTPGLTSVGTLIVRIVAARNLPAATGGGFFSSGSSNPYCILEFEGHTQATSVVAGSLDPVWPREQYFFDVKMPVMHAESDEDGYYSSVSYHTAPPSAAAAADASSSGYGGGGDGLEKPLKGGGLQGGKLSGMFSSSEPHLHVMLVHKEGASKSTPPKPSASAAAASSPSRAHAQAQAQTPRSDPSEVVKPGKGGGGKGGAPGVPEGDKLLGEAFVNVVDLATARAKSLDEWFPLSEGGAVRLVVEYDVIEAPPQPGEVVRLLGFGSASDLWPLPLRQEMVVERYVDANRDRLLVAYDTNEGWRCRAEVHRFHVISAGRHQTLVDEYQNKMLDAAIALWDLPLWAPAGTALDRICEGEPFGVVAGDMVEELSKLGNRWWEGGLSTMVADVKEAIRPKSAVPPPAVAEEGGRSEGGAAGAGGAGLKTTGEEEEDIYQDGFEEGEAEYQFDFIPQQDLQRICCPITGLPMRDPVLAADGQAYERSAIQRWLSVAKTSPVTGVTLRTFELYDCRAMRETVQEFRDRNEALRRKAAAAITKGAFSRPGSRASNASSTNAASSRTPSPVPLPPRAPASATSSAVRSAATAAEDEAQRTALSASPLPPLQEEGATAMEAAVVPPVEEEGAAAVTQQEQEGRQQQQEGQEKEEMREATEG